MYTTNELFDLTLSERQVQCLAAGLVMVLEDNGLKIVGAHEHG
ncbi:MAG: hypothetical protein ACPLPR_02325 [Bacillota bacterium]